MGSFKLIKDFGTIKLHELWLPATWRDKDALLVFNIGKGSGRMRTGMNLQASCHGDKEPNHHSLIGVQTKVTKSKTIVLRYCQCKLLSRYEKW